MDSYWNVKHLGNDFPVSTTLSRQGSIYSWTVDQYQASLGIDCGSMNMDELVKNISNAEETQEGLQRQGSITLPRIFSQRSVDEVLNYTTEEEYINDHGGGRLISEIQRQQPLGDITLENILLRSGARGSNTNGGYIHDSSTSSSLITGIPNTNMGVQFQPKAMVSDLMNNMVPRSHDSRFLRNVNGSVPTYQPQQPIMSKPNGYAYGTQIGSSTGFMGIGDQRLQENKRSFVPSVASIPSGAMTSSSNTPAQLLTGIQKMNGESSLVTPSPHISSASTGMSGRRNNNVGIAADKKVIDKRQRRKILNRESAARSRARKQAQNLEVIVELEKLKKEYQELLRKHTEMSNMQTEPAKEIINRPERPALRRTKSDIK